MLLPTALLLPLVPHILAARPAKRHYDSHDYYVIEHDPTAPFAGSLLDVSRALGVEVVEQAGELVNHWLVRAEKPVLSSINGLAARDSHDGADVDSVTATFHRLRTLARPQNDAQFTPRSEEHLQARSVASSVKYLARQTPRQRVKRAPPPVTAPTSEATASRQVAARLGIQDPLFPDQWHLVNNDYPEHMMNVTGVWEMGITGKGVIASMVDDGVDYESEDLKDNFDAYDSHDFNDHEDLPTPKLFDDHHGTRCAGQIAAGKNNFCGMGIAYESKVAGVRILSGPITDVDEAAALNYGFQNVSVYSCSWGPPDNGQSMEGPEYLINKAVLNGINNGRGGKGSIFVFASGNGAANGDQCNFDGYTNSIYSVTVSAIDHKGGHPYYSEPCAANMIVAYSSGDGHQIVTTDKGKDKCSTSHGGTSAAAPNAAGVFTLALQARPDLTWRDIQHLCVLTARQVNHDDGWEMTAAGRPYSYRYGYGALDGYAFVKAAQDWTLVKPQAWFESKPVQIMNGVRTVDGTMMGGQPIPPGGLTSSLEITPEMLQDNNFETLEHVRVRVWITHTRRGDVAVEVISPNGVKSMLAEPRQRDADTTGFPGWTFMTIKHWGENPVGNWTIRVSDQANPGHGGNFLGWNMMFWGSVIDAAKAQRYELALVDDVFPPIEGPHDVLPAPQVTPSVTKTFTKPTVHLTDQPEATSKPQDDTAQSNQGTSTPTPDEAWFSDMSSLSVTSKWFFGALAVVGAFALAAGTFFWRRRKLQQRDQYSSLSGDDVPMSSRSRGGLMSGSGIGGAGGSGAGTRELYDAFGEVSDDEDEDADEQTRLKGGQALRDGIGFHSGFLDDDHDEQGPTVGYKDEPEPEPAHASSSTVQRRDEDEEDEEDEEEDDDEDEDDEDEDDDDEDEDEEDEEEEDEPQQGRQQGGVHTTHN